MLDKTWRLIAGNWPLYAAAMIVQACGTAIWLLVPFIMRYAVDTLIGGLPADWALGTWMPATLFGCALLIVGMTVVQGGFMFGRGAITAIAAERIAKDLKDKLYDRLQRMPYEYHVKARTGDLVQRCTSDVETIRGVLAAQLTELTRIIFLAVIAIGFMLTLHVPLTLVAVIPLPLVIIASVIFSGKVEKAFHKVDVKEGELSAVLQENLSGVRVVRAFGREQFEIDKFEEKSREHRDLAYVLMRKLATFWSISDAFGSLQIAAVLGFGVYLAFHDAITLGTLLVFITYANMLTWPIRELGRILSHMGMMVVSFDRVNEVLETPVETDTPGAVKADLSGDIVFDNVRFGYGEGADVLNGLSFTVKRGETIAILGGTGSGKSTIMHLLLRLYDYESGSITINGTELKNIEKSWLRQKIGIVLQEPFLFSKTIMANIEMAKDSVSALDIYAAMETAAMHDVTAGFPAGYDTIVGERGVTLSGGQKQRLAIARTLIKDCDILIFDDSLSAVDTETDLQIRTALKERRQGVTTFIISQRVTTLMDADRIFVLEAGKLADCGSHEALTSRDGLYRRIWGIQSMRE